MSTVRLVLLGLMCALITVFPKLSPAQTDLGTLYPFELKDTLGQVVKADQFKGKALVIDFWFTGCKGCVQVAEMLHNSVMPAFARDSNVVFLSVSVDVNLLQWKRSLRTGLYANEHQVNLFTMGMGTKHPLFQHYRFSGCPQMLVVSRTGKVLSNSIPDGAATLKEIINNAKL